MSLFVDRQYIQQASRYLDRFTKVNDKVWRFRCPFCGDSASRKHIARGYAYVKKNHIIFHCHNCGKHVPLRDLLEHVNHNMANEYTLESYLQRSTEKKTFSFDEPSSVLEQRTDFISLPTITSLGQDHKAYRYLLSRKLPIERYSEIYYTDNFRNYVLSNSPEQAEKLPLTEERIILPFFSQDGRFVGYQGRVMHDFGLRYLTIKLTDDKKIWGANKVDLTKPVYVTEGIFDAMFLPNSLATLDSSLYNVRNILQFSDLPTLVFDNERDNREIVQKMEASIDQGFPVCIWSKGIKKYGKDINRMIMNGLSQERVFEEIKSRTFQGLRAKLEFMEWKK